MRIPKNSLSKRPMPFWIRKPRVAGDQEMATGQSLQRNLNHFDLPTLFTEWAHLAQDRAGWHELVTTPPFAIGKPFVRATTGRHKGGSGGQAPGVAHHAAEISERHAAFDATISSWVDTVLHWQPCTSKPRYTNANFP